MKYNVLILEDKQAHFQQIENILKEVNYFPTTDEKDKKINGNSFLSDFAFVENEYKKLTSSNKTKTGDEAINKANRDEFFSKLHNQFSESNKVYSHYIVDYELNLRSEDKLGLDFMAFLEDKSLNSDSITIILSGDSLPSYIVTDEIFESRYKFIQKTGNWQKELSKFLNLDIQNNLNNEEVKSNSFKTSRTVRFRYNLDRGFHIFFLFIIFCCIFLVIKNVMVHDLNIDSNLFKYEKKQNKISKNINLQSVNSDTITDTQEKKSLKGNFESNFEKNEQNNYELKDLEKISGQEKEDKDLKLLKFAEHIFLYLIPLFIVFGFFSYYYFEFRRVLLKLALSPSDSLNAQNTIAVTKTLFISSILSYSIIKTIEKIYLSEDFDYQKILAYGGFLVLLMGYLLLSHKSHGKN